MPAKLISLIYFYVVSTIGLVLIIIGVFHTVNFIINSTQYDMYPLRYSSASCEYPYLNPKGPYPASLDVQPATPSAGERMKQVQECETLASLDRKQHRLDDLKNAITFSLVGILVFGIHFPLARKQSKA